MNELTFVSHGGKGARIFGWELESLLARTLLD